MTRSRSDIKIILSVLFCLVFHSTSLAACWVIEWEECSVPDDSCGLHACKNVGLPFMLCGTSHGTFSSFGGYKTSRAAVTQSEIDAGGTQVETDYNAYIYCTQSIACNTNDPCVGHCGTDGAQTNAGTPTFYKKFGSSSQSCPGAK